jgi:hypothetical protein
MSPLRPWMRYLLRFAGTFNLLAGLGMCTLYHEGLQFLGFHKQLGLPTQIMGVLVGLFGVGYHLVASNPVENRNLLMLGFWSKAISSVFAVWYVIIHKIVWWFAPIVFFADIIYLPFFYVILRELYAAARAQRAAGP